MNAKAIRNLDLYLHDMLQAAREIQEFCAVDEAVFMQDRMRQRAVIQCFEVLGEACKKLPASVRDRYPELPWRYMAAFRDKLIHDYFEIDLQLVWSTARQEIPKLIPQLDTIACMHRRDTDI